MIRENVLSLAYLRDSRDGGGGQTTGSLQFLIVFTPMTLVIVEAREIIAVPVTFGVTFKQVPQVSKAAPIQGQNWTET